MRRKSEDSILAKLMIKKILGRLSALEAQVLDKFLAQRSYLQEVLDEYKDSGSFIKEALHLLHDDTAEAWEKFKALHDTGRKGLLKKRE